MRLFWKTVSSPVGQLKLVAGAKGLRAILWENDPESRVPLGDMEENPEHPVLVKTAKQLKEYFEGRRKQFSLLLDFCGTEFQKQVWRELQLIPYGETRSYADIARRIGNPKAVRAVGAANGRNPISIVAACHRVIGSNGKLTGFAGGLKAKRFLLRLESGADAGFQFGSATGGV